MVIVSALSVGVIGGTCQASDRNLPDRNAKEVSARTAHCAPGDQAYLYYSPDKDHALPAVMLLHGAGDRAVNMVDAWKRFAQKQQIVLLAPELPRDPKFEDTAPQMFRCVAEDAKQFVHIDPQRVYLFGNSMGGYLAYDAAIFESQYFAAAAVHAMRIADDYTWIVNRAQRKTPIAIYIGDHDQFFTVASVHKTRDLLLKAGFPVHYVEFINHDHNYYDRSDEINADAWKFLKEQRLAAPPVQP
jgi:poly(3-hydroxybutyrate) depolymerase